MYANIFRKGAVMLIGLLILLENTRNNIFTLWSLRMLLQASPQGQREMCRGWPHVVAGDREGGSQSQLWDRSRQDHTIQE